MTGQMPIIRERAYARAGLVGNPSDGYHGKTISLIVRNLFADVILYEWDEIELLWSSEDKSRFASIQELADDVKLHGYYGGIRLVKATIKRFGDFCRAEGLPLHDRRFAVRYESTIPRQVGLAGSSAIIIATLRCLMRFYDVSVPRHILPSLALAVETRELGIAGGLQDRVIQTYEGLVFMDFDTARTQKHAQTHEAYEYGAYEELDPALLPPLYIAYKSEVGEPTEVFHNDIRSRFLSEEPAVVQAMQALAALAEEARAQLLEGRIERLEQLINTNFDIRRSIYTLPAAQIAMIERARNVGVSAAFAGSGGAIVGVCGDGGRFDRLRSELRSIGCVVIKPIVAERRREPLRHQAR
jgi:glucuronokinase